MKLPSLDSLLTKSTAAFRRFPLALLMAILGAVCGIRIIHLPYDQLESHHYYLNMASACYLGMLLFIALTIYSERRELSLNGKFILLSGGLAAIIIYYLTLPGQFMVIPVIRFVLFSIGLHLIIAFVPFVGRGGLNGFWQYNKMLFLRILTAALYSSVLYLGLSLAILAIDQLFKVHMDGRIYGDLWILIAGIFNTWFFLAGFPADFSGLESQTEYPKGLKIFTQYVLLPLITVYLLILYAYMFKIIFTMEWPVGWVSYLVLGFSIAGILSLLLIFPIRNEEGNTWMLVYSRFFYFAIFPLIILLFLAIKRRITEYGVTENRYFVLVLALWLVLVSIYFLASKKKDIRLIPVTLCLFAFLTSFGPWGAFSVSLKSQKNHLMNLVEKNNMLSGGKIVKANAKISFDDHKEISSVIEYLVSVHGYRSLQPCFSEDLDSLMKTDSATISSRNSFVQAGKLLSLLNLSHVSRYQQPEGNYVDYRSETTHTLNIVGYDYFIPGFYANDDDSTDDVCSSYLLGLDSLKICFNMKTNLLSFTFQADSVLRFNVADLIGSLNEKNYTRFNSIKAKDLALTGGNEKLSVKVIFKSIYGANKQEKFTISRIQADLLIDLKNEKVNEVGERNP